MPTKSFFENYQNKSREEHLRIIEHLLQNARECEQKTGELQEAEKQLLQRDTDLAKAQELAHLGHWTWDIQNGKVNWSEEVYRIFGVDPGKFQATYDAYLNALYPADREKVNQAVNAALRKEKPYDITYRIVRPDGTIRYVHSQGEVIFNSAGEPERMLRTVLDITSQKQAEEAIRRQAALIDLSPDGIMVRLTDGTITLWSHGAEVMYGWTRQEAIGRKSHVLLKTRFPEPLEKIDAVLQRTGYWSGELTHFSKDGRELVVQSRWKLLPGDFSEKLEVLESNVDITEQKRAQKQLRDEKNRAELYLDVMGHDINNLNQVALVNLDLLQDDPALTPEQRELIADALNSVRGSASIIDNVRKIQVINENKLPDKPEDLDLMIQACITEAPASEGQQVTINYTLRGGMMIKSSPLMKEVFCNILDNAVKHSGRDVTIDIGVDETMPMGKKFYNVSIADNGPGIPDSLKVKLFNRFQRGDTKAHGRGLGLFIAKSLVEQAGGNVTVEDRVPGDYTKGAKFIVSLPACEECK